MRMEDTGKTGSMSGRVVQFPKNIRQIGQLNQENKIYMEDYVLTYLNRILNEEEMGSRAVLLLGKYNRQSDNNLFFIYGAICTEKKRLEDGQPLFDEADKDYLISVKEEYFPELDILGWALLENEFNCISDDCAWKNGSGQFGNQNKLFMRSDTSGMIERFKLYENGVVINIPGYAIFYDKNESMQSYLIEWHKERREISIEKVKDTATRQFRSVIMERQEGNYHRKSMSFFYLASTMLMIVLCATGITMVNQYEKMKHIEVAMDHLAETVEKQETDNAVPVMAEQKPISGMDAADLVALDKKAPSTEEAASGEAVSEETFNTEENAESKTEAEAAPETTTEASQQTGVESAPDTEEADHGVVKQGKPVEQISESPETPSPEKQAENAAETVAEPEQAVKTPEVQPEQKEPMVYYTKEGDTLEGISLKFYKTADRVKEISSLNQITDPNSIMCGQKILLP